MAHRIRKRVTNLVCTGLAVAAVFAAVLRAPIQVSAAELLVRVQAEALLEAGDAIAAVPLLVGAVLAAPDDPALLLLLGIAHFRSGANGLATDTFERAIQMDPTAWQPRFNLGVAHFRAGRWTAATRAFLAVPRHAPDKAPQAYLNAALARLSAHDRAGAIPLLQQVVVSDPDGLSGANAQRLLDRISGQRQGTTAARRSAPPKSPWHVRMSVGRAFDSNVQLRPDDIASPRKSDWQTTVQMRVEYAVPLGARWRLVPAYHGFGRWYTSESGRDFAFQSLQLRLEDPRGRWRPRVGYRFGQDFLGGESFLNRHRLDTRAQLVRRGGLRVYGRGYAELDVAPGERFEYLSGARYHLGLTALQRLSPSRRLRLDLSLEETDKKDRFRVATPGVAENFDSYSYRGIGAQLHLRQAITRDWSLEVAGGYRIRRYMDDERFGALASPAVPVFKRRLDRRVSAHGTLRWAATPGLTVELRYDGRFNQSNLGDAPGDDRDRDYIRHVAGLTLRAAF